MKRKIRFRLLPLAALAALATATGGSGDPRREDPAPPGARDALRRARTEEALVRSERTAVLLARLLAARKAWRLEEGR